MIRWTGLAPWEFEFPFSGSITSTFIELGRAPRVKSLRGVEDVHFVELYEGWYLRPIDFCIGSYLRLIDFCIES